ncbi:MAG: hypothetical protein J0J06_03745 [Sphingomonas sp.]|uniref:hypothetical protein n=1 Tax=Sphingomonas sp. TaxID=28214 RepID=UPI001ACEED68|nr:hypothetical protein [Sphingomonas sp.]MBN8814545.1 hypothetical protein [Sphingomonas sp.]
MYFEPLARSWDVETFDPRTVPAREKVGVDLAPFQPGPLSDAYELSSHRIGEGIGAFASPASPIVATVMLAKDGGSIRTFAGARGSECAQIQSFRAKRTLHCEGEAAEAFVTRCESDPEVAFVVTETPRVVVNIPADGRKFTYTADALVTFRSGVRRAIEIKRSERDLANPKYRQHLAIAFECFRREGLETEVVMRDQIFANRHHSRNCELVAMHQFVEPTLRHLACIERLAKTNGTIAYGCLAACLEPDRPVYGKAVIHALVVRHRVTFDLRAWLNDDTPVTISKRT